MNYDLENKVKNAKDPAKTYSPQITASEVPWADLQRLLEQMDFPDGSTAATNEEKAAQDSHEESIDKPVESKAEKAEPDAHMKHGVDVVEQFQNELSQSLMGLTNTLAETGLLDKKTARKRMKMAKREDKLRLKELKKKMREIKKNGS